MPFFTNASDIVIYDDKGVGRAQDPQEIARQAVANAGAAFRNLQSHSIGMGSSDASTFVNNHALLDRTTTLAEGSQQLSATNGSSFIVGSTRVMSSEEREELNAKQLDAMRRRLDRHQRRNEQRIANRQGYRSSTGAGGRPTLQDQQVEESRKVSVLREKRTRAKDQRQSLDSVPFLRRGHIQSLPDSDKYVKSASSYTVSGGSSGLPAQGGRAAIAPYPAHTRPPPAGTRMPGRTLAGMSSLTSPPWFAQGLPQGYLPSVSMSWSKFSPPAHTLNSIPPPMGGPGSLPLFDPSAIPQDDSYPTDTSPWSGPILPLFSYPRNGQVPSGFGPQLTFNHPPTALNAQPQPEVVTEATQDNAVEDEELKDDRAPSTNIGGFFTSEQNRDTNAATSD